MAAQDEALLMDVLARQTRVGADLAKQLSIAMASNARMSKALHELRTSFAQVADAPESSGWPEAHERRRAKFVVDVCDKGLIDGHD